MSVQEAVMANGQWTVTLDPGTPTAVTDRLRDPFTLLKIYPARIDPDQVPAQTPMYTGLWLRSRDRTSCEGAGPCILLGGAGSKSSSAGVLSSGAWGPDFNAASDAGPGYKIQDWVAAIVGKNGVTQGTVIQGAVQITPSYAQTSARDWLDNMIVPTWAVEYRLNPDLTLDVNDVDTLYGSTAKRIISTAEAVDPAKGLAATQLDAELDYTSYRNRAVIRWRSSDGSSTGVYNTGFPSSGFSLPGGDTLEWADFEDSGQSSDDAQHYADWLLPKSKLPARQLDVTVTDPDVAGVATTLVGAHVAVWAPDRGLYDLDNAQDYAGGVIYPALVRCLGATWPIRAGMGVYLHDGTNDRVTDLSDYVVAESPSTTLTVGALPVGIDGQRRTI